METKLKNNYIEEVKYQMRMLNHLKRWLKTFSIFSSISLILIIFGPSVHFLVRPFAIVMMIISIFACVIIGLGLKNGKDNVSKIIDYIEN